MRSLFHALTAVLVLAASSNALAGAPNAEKGERSLAKLLEGRTVGKPVNCIDPQRAQAVEIIDGTAIVYRMPGGGLYVNLPSAGAAMLDQEVMLRSRTNGTRLCRWDGVTLIGQGPGSPFAVGLVRLGEFVPYGKVER